MVKCVFLPNLHITSRFSCQARETDAWGFQLPKMRASCGVVVVWLLLFHTSALVAHLCLQNSVFDINELLATQQSYADTYPTDNNTQPIRLRIDTSYLDNDLLHRTCTTTGQVVDTQSNPYQCQSDDVLTPSLRQYLGNLLSQARTLFQNTLKVIPVDGDFLLQGGNSPQGLYGGVYLSSEYTSGIPNLDVVIFVTARPIVQDGSATGDTLAVARVVQEDQVFFFHLLFFIV